MKKLTLFAAMAASVSLSVNAFDVERKYAQTCAACHAMGVAGAPKSFDVGAWQPRMAEGMDKMVESVANGMNAMPPRGLCMDCTTEQYEALIEYMAAPK
ncbi:MAG: c-type cytochrome [Pseudomonadota bacterium]|nr:cytochrome c5 family protein [Pseudomonas sp.]MEC8444142.1 c-type cytochrome [Pseudomonadota bacterium]